MISLLHGHNPPPVAQRLRRVPSTARSASPRPMLLDREFFLHAEQRRRNGAGT